MVKVGNVKRHCAIHTVVVSQTVGQHDVHLSTQPGVERHNMEKSDVKSRNGQSRIGFAKVGFAKIGIRYKMSNLMQDWRRRN